MKACETCENPLVRRASEWPKRFKDVRAQAQRPDASRESSWETRGRREVAVSTNDEKHRANDASLRRLVAADLFCATEAGMDCADLLVGEMT